MDNDDIVNLEKRENIDDTYNMLKNKYGFDSEDDENEKSWNEDDVDDFDNYEDVDGYEDEEIDENEEMVDNEEEILKKLRENNSEDNSIKREIHEREHLKYSNLLKYNYFRYPMLYTNICDLERVSNCYFKYEDNDNKYVNNIINTKYVNISKMVSYSPYNTKSNDYNYYKSYLISYENYLYNIDQKLAIIKVCLNKLDEKNLKILREFFYFIPNDQDINDFLKNKMEELISLKNKFLENNKNYIDNLFELYIKNDKKMIEYIQDIYNLENINKIIFDKLDSNSIDKINKLNINLNLTRIKIGLYNYKPNLLLKFSDINCLNYSIKFIVDFLDLIYMKKTQSDQFLQFLKDINLFNNDIESNFNLIEDSGVEDLLNLFIQSVEPSIFEYKKNLSISEDNEEIYQSSLFKEFPIAIINNKIQEKKVYPPLNINNYTIHKLDIFQTKFLIIFQQIYLILLDLTQENSQISLENIKQLVILNFTKNRINIQNKLCLHQKLVYSLNSLYYLFNNYFVNDFFLETSFNKEFDEYMTIVNNKTDQEVNIYLY